MFLVILHRVIYTRNKKILMIKIFNFHAKKANF